jgi:thiol-disulfide isomerase/thioredoxin
MNKHLICVFGILLFSLVGCETNNTPGNHSIPATNKSTADTVTTKENENKATDGSAADNGSADINVSANNNSSDSIPLEIKTWDEVQAWIASQQGKVVVLDLWSTYCGPCRREFPRLVALHDQGNEQIACASLSLDFYGGSGKPESVQPQVLEFLKSKNATMQNFISSTPDSDVLQAIAADAVPVTLIYDQTGKLHKVFKNDNNEYGPEGFTYDDDIEPLVQQLVQ